MWWSYKQVSECVCMWWFLKCFLNLKEKTWTITWNGTKVLNESKASNKKTNGTSPIPLLLIRMKMTSILTQLKARTLL